MKPLSQMTREELWALDENDVYELIHAHGMRLPPKMRTVDNYLECLEDLRLELQQSAADAGRDTLKDR